MTYKYRISTYSATGSLEHELVYSNANSVVRKARETASESFDIELLEWVPVGQQRSTHIVEKRAWREVISVRSGKRIELIPYGLPKALVKLAERYPE